MRTFEFSDRTRALNLEKMQSQQFDVLVIGGGITGVGIARDAALRGLSVALIEKSDFAGGTSSKSSKLIHGGLRYLEKAQFKLVFEALRERHLLQKMLPQLVGPIPFLLPIYRSGRINFFKMAAGMWLYDALSLFRCPKLHSTFFKKGILQKESFLSLEGLQGGFLFYDCFTNDALLTLEVARSAHQEGAVLANYVRLIGFDKTDNQIKSARVQNGFTTEIFSIQAKYFINATGPWSEVVQKFSSGVCSIKLRPTKGVHVIFPRSVIPVQHVVTLQARDGRFIYLIPWGEHCLLGTTDTDYHGPGGVENISATREEVDYLIESVRRYFPRSSLSDSDIISTYAGIRPLVHEEKNTEYRISREHQIVKDSFGLITIVGGKLTTYREMAKEAVDLISDQPCITDRKPFVPRGMDSAYAHTLSERRLESFIQWGMAQTLSDVMVRRTEVFLKAKDQGISSVPEIASYMARRLGWSQLRLRQEIEAFKQQVMLSKQFLLKAC